MATKKKKQYKDYQDYLNSPELTKNHYWNTYINNRSMCPPAEEVI